MTDNLKSITFEGYNVDVSLFEGEESFKVLHLLQSKIFPALASVFSGVATPGDSGSIKDAQVNLSALREGIENLFKNIGDENEAFKLVSRILKGVTVYTGNGGKILHLNNAADFNTFFMGQIELAYKLCFEVLKLNYPFFLANAKLSGLMNVINTFGERAQQQQNGGGNSGISESYQKGYSQAGHTGDSVVASVLQSQT